MKIYRVAYRRYAEAPFDGEGAYLYGGRWSSPGTRLAYAATTLSLAMLEFLAHVEAENFDPTTPPELVYVVADLPASDVAAFDDLGIALPADWDAVPARVSTMRVGDAFARDAAFLALTVPSVHLPRLANERNVLLNPKHVRFGDVAFATHDLFYDRRLLAARKAAEGVTPPHKTKRRRT